MYLEEEEKIVKLKYVYQINEKSINANDNDNDS